MPFDLRCVASAWPHDQSHSRQDSAGLYLQKSSNLDDRFETGRVRVWDYCCVAGRVLAEATCPFKSSA